jgi:hypothetical protein
MIKFRHGAVPKRVRQHFSRNVAPHVGEAQGVGLFIFGSFAVFETLKVTIDGANSPSQLLGDGIYPESSFKLAIYPILQF